MEAMSHPPPLIALCARVLTFSDEGKRDAFSSSQPYSRAIARAGGVPVLVPPIRQLALNATTVLKHFDGVLLPGGGDVDPRRYGQEPDDESLYGILADHDDLDIAVCLAAIELDLPMLALCRGMQVLNVALGGTLQQDIGTESHWFAEQVVDLEPDSAMAAAMGTDTPTCHCVHHQGLEPVADGVHVVGRTADGLIHAAEVTSMRFGLAVQWHPEDTAASDPTQQSLFTTLVAHT